MEAKLCLSCMVLVDTVYNAACHCFQVVWEILQGELEGAAQE